MIRIAGSISRECEILGMPFLVISYPRKEVNGLDENYMYLKNEDNLKYAQLVSHSVRIATDLGADIVKTQYTGSVESFSMVVDNNPYVPIITSGGPIIPQDEVVSNAENAILSGAVGVCFGRNVFGSNDVCGVIKKLKSIIFKA